MHYGPAVVAPQARTPPLVLRADVGDESVQRVVGFRGAVAQVPASRCRPRLSVKSSLARGSPRQQAEDVSAIAAAHVLETQPRVIRLGPRDGVVMAQVHVRSARVVEPRAAENLL
eukprot:scaffold2135_cov341-Prasinococcus_capsulatus_cf.AAC.1